MTYQIYYTPKDEPKGHGGWCMFDIEYYMKNSGYGKDKDGNIVESTKWYSELHCLPRVEGIARFLKDKLSEEGFDIETFITDAEVIQEIRGLLYERYHNQPKERDEASEFHYHAFGKTLKKKLGEFCEHYNLYLNID